MATTYLDVPFREREQVKARGARWDSDARKWFVPAGRSLEAFSAWLPADPTPAVGQELADPSKGIPLSQLLAGVSSAVAQAFRQGVWTTAEVVRVDGSTHVYLELAERDASGALIAKAKAIVWSRDVERVLGGFQVATGVRLAAGIKLLIRARPEFSAQWGLSLLIDAIDPSYTLGDLEARKRQIREQLKGEGIFERNRQLASPWDYRLLLVVSPPRAAGLGDFARDADRLQQHGLCQAIYAHSRFEGEGAAGSIREAIEAALARWTEPALPDAIVIIRGGGAVNDLAWLNDYELARYICLSDIPVLTGIGHERDSTILDEVAHQRFDTPSKVAAGIQSLIVKRSREAQAAFDEVVGLALRQLNAAATAVEQLDAGVQQHAQAAVHAARTATESRLAAIERQAQQTLHDATQRAHQAVSDVRASAANQLATARARASSAKDSVSSDAAADLGQASKNSAALKEEIGRVAWNSLRWGREGAEGAFREVVTQGPERTLGRGFAVVRTAAGKIVSSAAAARESAELRVQFQDGTIGASASRDKESA